MFNKIVANIVKKIIYDLFILSFPAKIMSYSQAKDVPRV